MYMHAVPVYPHVMRRICHTLTEDKKNYGSKVFGVEDDTARTILWVS